MLNTPLRFSIALALTMLVVLATSRLPTTAHATAPNTQSTPPRIETYDSRAIAIAFGRSEQVLLEIADLRRRHDAAVAAGDQRLAKELSEQGQARQIRPHLQAFSTAPVNDALDTVREELPRVARDSQVIAIVRAADYRDPSIEVVDVTDEVVSLFNPTDQTLQLVKESRNKEPLPIEQVAKLPAKK